MAYVLKQVTIRTDRTEQGIKKIDDLWADIKSGKLPIFYNSEQVYQENIASISKYSNYSNKDLAEFDLTIMGGCADFYEVLEMKVSQGLFIKYYLEEETDDIAQCVKKIWEKVWADQEAGIISRNYIEDYESSLPTEYRKDGLTCCTLYIGVHATDVKMDLDV